MKDAESLLSLLSLHKGPSGFTFHLSPFDRNPGAKTYFSILGKTSVQAQQLIDLLSAKTFSKNTKR